MVYEFLLRFWADTGDEQALEMVTTTLTWMARGGMYDQLGGGFHRYSTDTVWLVPHFEKMLYDNALLVPLYLHGWQITGDEFFQRVAEQVLGYVEREMLHPDGGFYSAQDADSEGEEGKFFVWTAEEFAEVLGEDLGRTAAAYWGVSRQGNWEGKNILWAPRTDEEVARELNLSVESLSEKLAEARRKLFESREQRVRPGLDDKVITSWNALMLKAFAEAGAMFDNDHYVEIARRNAAFLERTLVDSGRVLRTWKDDAAGGAAHLKGYLEDYAFQADALTVLYESTFEPYWLERAAALADGMIDLFWDEDRQVFYDTGRDHESLLVRPRDVFDNAHPCGGSAASWALLRLGTLTGNDRYRAIAEANLRAVGDLLTRAPSGFANWLAALDYATAAPKEIAIMGPRCDAKPLLEVVFGRYLPNRVVAGHPNGTDGVGSPLLKGRDAIGGVPTAYVCEDYACQLPVTTPNELLKQLREVSAPA